MATPPVGLSGAHGSAAWRLDGRKSALPHRHSVIIQTTRAALKIPVRTSDRSVDFSPSALKLEGSTAVTIRDAVTTWRSLLLSKILSASTSASRHPCDCGCAMTSTTSVLIAPPAYLKAVLHAARYPASPILGLLTTKATVTSKPATTPSKHPPLTLTALDALPLFHSDPVGPLLELALLQADVVAAGRGERVCGVYVASERYERKDVTPIAQRIANQLTAHNPGQPSLILLLDNGRLAHGRQPPEVAFDALVQASGGERWVAVPSSGVTVTADTLNGDALKRARELLLADRQDEVVDFEAHIENVTLDWTNAHIA